MTRIIPVILLLSVCQAALCGEAWAETGKSHPDASASLPGKTMQPGDPGRKVFLAGTIMSSLVIASQSAGWFPYAGPAMSLFAVPFLAMIQGGHIMGRKHAKQAGIELSARAKGLYIAGWIFIGLAAGSVIGPFLFSPEANHYMYALEDWEKESGRDDWEKYLVFQYALSVPLMLTAFSLCVAGWSVMARDIRNTGFIAPSKALSEKVLFFPSAYASESGAGLALNGVF